MAYDRIQPDYIKYEARVVQGQDPTEAERKRPGGFARFLSGCGKVLGAVAAPLSFIFPPAAIGAATMYGVGTLGDQMQQRNAQKEFEQMQRENATVISYPGLDASKSASNLRPASFGVTQQPQAQAGMTEQDAAVMSVLFARNTMMMQTGTQIEGSE